MKCRKCKKEIDPETLKPEFAQHFEGQAELRAKHTCGQEFYTFVTLDWEPLEN